MTIDLDYLRDPTAIEALSFARIRQLTSLEHLDRDQQQVVMRLVHTWGDPELAGRLAMSPGAVAAGVAALKAGGPVLVDVAMVRQGIDARRVPGQVMCFLDQPWVAERAIARGHTRTMTAVDAWPDYLAGAVVAVGNAPTALFRLLELLQGGAPRPALIIATVVGFVGAMESKAALVAVAKDLALEYLTLPGPLGGSPLAAAAVNALARLAHGHYL